MIRAIFLWLGIFILAGLTLAITAQFMISPIWVVNAFAAYYSIRCRKQLKNVFIIGLFSASAILSASLCFDFFQDIPDKIYLSLLSGLQVSVFVYIYYFLSKNLYYKHSRYRRTILLTIPNILSSFLCAWLFIFIPKQGESYLEFLDYFLEQVSTGLAVICLLAGLKRMKQIEARDYLVMAFALLMQYFVSISPIFYNCFIIPLFLVYFAMRYSVIRFSYLVGLLSIICTIYVSIPLAGQFWAAQDINLLSRLSVYRSGIAMSIVIYLFMCEIQNINKNLYHYLARVSFKDALTGLNNRRFMQDKILSGDELHHGLLLLMDIDDFKKVNDQYGHHIGDLVLKKFAQLIERTMPENAQIFRWGGEEFLVLIKHIPSTNHADLLCQKLIAVTKNVKFKCEGYVIESSLSVGAVQFPNFSERNYHHIINHADQLLYQAKSQGKKRYILV